MSEQDMAGTFLAFLLGASVLAAIAGFTKRGFDSHWQHKCVNAGVAEFYIGDDGQRCWRFKEVECE